MSTRTVLAAVLSFTMCAPAAALAAGPGHHPAGINARQQRQTTRIKNGVKNDELTRGETARLRADEAAIRQEARVYRQSGGGLSPAERRDLERDLNRVSRQIYRAKHNGRTPDGGR
jgi:Spy/CpxP family protein refolding chaperone